MLSGVAAGASEKELAAQLGLSTHTLHDHVKAVHRAYRVRSGGELLARWGADMRQPRVRLVIEARGGSGGSGAERGSGGEKAAVDGTGAPVR